ncbi:ADP-heptose synthase, partial [Sulfurimonas sp. MAG313]
KEGLENLGVDVSLYKDSTRPTTLKQRFRANGKTLLRVNHLKQHGIENSIEKKIIDEIKQEIDSYDLIVFSDFSYGVLTKKIISQVSKMAKDRNIFTSADSQSSSQIGDISKFKNMTLVTPTEREIRLSLNDFESGLVVLSDKLRQLSNMKYIFTTLGAEGILIYNSHENELLTDSVTALGSSVKDVSGAGDSLMISSSMALATGASIWESAYLGSLASAIQVSRIGNIPISKSELLNELK